MSNLEVSIDEHMKAYLEKLPALAKLQIIAEVETIKAVVEISGSLSASIMRVTGKRIPLDIDRQRLLALVMQVSGFEKERDRWLEDIKQYNVVGSVDARLWATLKGNFDFEEKRASEARAQTSSDQLKLFSRQLAFAEECLTEVQHLTALLVPAVAAIRRELSIPMDVQEYHAVMQALVTKQRAALTDFLETARQSVNTT